MRLLSEANIPIGERISIDCAFCSAVAIVRSGSAATERGQDGWQCGVEFLTLRVRRERGSLLSALA